MNFVTFLRKYWCWKNTREQLNPHSSADEILVLIAYAQMAQMNVHEEALSEVKSFNPFRTNESFHKATNN